MIPWGRTKREVVHVPQPELASAGATFGPWADHSQRCKCNVCR